MKIVVDIGIQLISPRRSFALEAKFAAADERIVIFGPSGAGKSLTMQMIAGLQRPDRGRIELDGRVLFDAAAGINVPARERGVGLVFQDYALFPHLTVEENVAFPLRGVLPLRLPDAERRKIEDMLELFELTPLARSLPRDLSGGQRQRVALARTLVCEPRVMLLDEPFAALDSMLRNRVRYELLQMQQRFKVPMVIITHDFEDVKTFADTLVIYLTGRIGCVIPIKETAMRRGEDNAWEEVYAACGMMQ